MACGKALLIVNPDSGKQDGRLLACRVSSILEESFGSVECRFSSCAEDVSSWSREARECGFDALFVMGGDGTVSLGLRGLFDGASADDRIPAFGIIPGGTGNGLARTLRLPFDPEQAAASYDCGKTIPFDVGLVDGEPFAYTVTGGALPEGIREVPSKVKSRFGFLAYAVSELLRVGSNERHKLRIVVDGRETVETISSFVAFSANVLVNDFTTAKNTRVDSGKVHLIALKSASVPALLSIVPYIITRSVDKSDQVLFLHGESIEISCLDGGLTCGVDGDEGPDLPIRLDVRPGALRMFALEGKE